MLATKSKQLKPFREVIVVYFENHIQHTNVLCEQNAEFLYSENALHIVTTEL
jgi:hypothetical protein